MCHVSCVPCHVSRVTCHVSPVTCQNNFFWHFLFIKRIWQSVGASRWRVCYQQGLSCLFYFLTPCTKSQPSIWSCVIIFGHEKFFFNERNQRAAPSTFYPMSICEVFLTKKCLNLSFVNHICLGIIWVFSFIKTKVFKFGQNVSLWI